MNISVILILSFCLFRDGGVFGRRRRRREGGEEEGEETICYDYFTSHHITLQSHYDHITTKRYPPLLFPLLPLFFFSNAEK
jgi:hypothetical protein